MKCPYCDQDMQVQESRTLRGFRGAWDMSETGEIDVAVRIFTCPTCHVRVSTRQEIMVYPILPDEFE